MPLLCLLRLLPHTIFLSAHYCCPCNTHLRITSRTKSLLLSDTTAFLSQTHCLLLLLVKMNSPWQLKVWTITSAVRKVRPHALQPAGAHCHICICRPEPLWTAFEWMKSQQMSTALGQVYAAMSENIMEPWWNWVRETQSNAKAENASWWELLKLSAVQWCTKGSLLTIFITVNVMIVISLEVYTILFALALC